MPGNAQKTPFASSLNRVAMQNAVDAIQKLGKAWPCSVTAVSGAIVTVKFEVISPYTLPPVTMPLFGPEYIRYPTQVGDKGVTFPADAYLGGVSGLGGGIANTQIPAGNLSALVFFPCGNKNWSEVDPNAVTIYGPNGVALRNTEATSSIIILPAGVAVIGQNYVNITCGACSIQMTPTALTMTDATAATSPAIMNAAWSALVSWLNGHTHPDPQGGSSGTPSSPFSGGSIAP